MSRSKCHRSPRHVVLWDHAVQRTTRAPAVRQSKRRRSPLLPPSCHLPQTSAQTACEKAGTKVCGEAPLDSIDRSTIQRDDGSMTGRSIEASKHGRGWDVGREVLR
jgi:hypothetical protein